MKINFDLLASPSVRPHTPNPYHTFVSEAEKITNRYAAQDQVIHKLNQSNKVANMIPIPATKIVEPEKQILSMKRLIAKEEEKAKKRMNPEELAHKLYSHSHCQRKECMNMKQRAKQQKLDSEATSVPPPRAINKKSTAYSSSRLHSEWIHREFRRTLQAENQDKRHTRYMQVKQPHNHVNFYERLGNVVQKYELKYRLYSGMLGLQCQNRKMFEPDIQVSKKSLQKVRRHFRQSSLKVDRGMNMNNTTNNMNNTTNNMNNTMNSINVSVCSLDRSLELVQDTQEHFFDRMRIIFAGERNICCVNSQAIKLLTEVEFDLMFEFINQIEPLSLTMEQFEARLRRYYQNMHVSHRLTLRSHEVKRKYQKYRVDEQDQKSEKDDSLKQTQFYTPIKSEYHKKMELFV